MCLATTRCRSILRVPGSVRTLLEPEDAVVVSGGRDDIVASIAVDVDDVHEAKLLHTRRCRQAVQTGPARAYAAGGLVCAGAGGALMDSHAG